MDKNKLHRINRAIGQLESLRAKVSTDDYDCKQVATQIKATIGAIKSLGKLIAEEDLERCLKKNVSKSKQKEHLTYIMDAISF